MEGPKNSALSGLPAVCNAVLSGLTCYVSINFYVKSGFNKHKKLAEPFSGEKFLLCQNWAKWDLFVPKINISQSFAECVY